MQKHILMIGEEAFAMNPHCVQIFVYFKDAWREENG